MTEQEKEFVKLIKENEGIIFKITRIYTNNNDDQNDLYQDIVFQLWQYFHTFKGQSKISTWMYRVALNTSITQLRKEKRKGQRVIIDHIHLKQTEDYDTELEDRLKILHDHIKRLNTIEKAMMLLLLEGKKYEEIAEITGFSTSNVGTRISRIKQKLKEQIIKT